MDKISIVQEQIAYHRLELLERIKNFSAMWRSLVVGLAAVVALSDKVDFEIAILMAVPLLALVFAYWLNEQASLQMVSAAAAQAERRLNALVGATVLTYETERTVSRGWFANEWAVRLVLVGALVGYFGLFTLLWPSPKFAGMDRVANMYIAVVVAAGMVVAVNGFRYGSLSAHSKKSLVNPPQKENEHRPGTPRRN